MRNIFLEQSYIKCGGETSPRRFSVKLKLKNFKILQFVLIVSQVVGYRNILKLNCRPLAFASFYAFLKNKKSSGTSLPVSFSA